MMILKIEKKKIEIKYSTVRENAIDDANRHQRRIINL